MSRRRRSRTRLPLGCRAHTLEGQRARLPSYRAGALLANIYSHQSTCQSQGRSHFTIVARFLINLNSLGAIHGSPPCHDTSFRGRNRSTASQSTLPI